MPLYKDELRTPPPLGLGPRLGLQLVGWTFAHPPRAHEVTVSELEQMAPMQKLLNSSQARPSIGAAHGGRWATGQRVRQKVGQRVGQRVG